MNEQAELWRKCVEFHGHECPGLAIGYQACAAARKVLGIGFSYDEELVCVTENDACGVDAVQVITGCTFGKGNLIFRPSGKQAFSFFRRDSGEGIRLVLVREGRSQERPEREERMRFLLGADPLTLFEEKSPSFPLPEKASLYQTVECSSCGEGTAEPFVRLRDGHLVCGECACT